MDIHEVYSIIRFFSMKLKLDQGTWLVRTLLDNFLVDFEPFFDNIGSIWTNLYHSVCLDPSF